MVKIEPFFFNELQSWGDSDTRLDRRVLICTHELLNRYCMTEVKYKYLFKKIYLPPIYMTLVSNTTRDIISN